jgi:hypothetical protein
VLGDANCVRGRPTTLTAEFSIALPVDSSKPRTRKKTPNNDKQFIAPIINPYVPAETVAVASTEEALLLTLFGVAIGNTCYEASEADGEMCRGVFFHQMAAEDGYVLIVVCEMIVSPRRDETTDANPQSTTHTYTRPNRYVFPTILHLDSIATSHSMAGDHEEMDQWSTFVSETILIGDVQYALVFVAYHVWSGAHYVGQGYFDDEGTDRWYKYDDLRDQGFVQWNESNEFDHEWYFDCKSIATYVRVDLETGTGEPSYFKPPSRWRTGDPTTLLSKQALRSLVTKSPHAPKGLHFDNAPRFN